MDAPVAGQPDGRSIGNPRTRAFLPHGLTECEKAHKDVRKKLSHCIKQAEKGAVEKRRSTMRSAAATQSRFAELPCIVLLKNFLS